VSKEQGYIHLEDLEWTADRVTHGVIVKLKEVPVHCHDIVNRFTEPE
jgi:hypothetical protein